MNRSRKCSLLDIDRPESGADEGARHMYWGHSEPDTEWESHSVLKYSITQPTKDNWDAADHLAHLYFNVKNINLQLQEGVFFGKN